MVDPALRKDADEEEVPLPEEEDEALNEAVEQPEPVDERPVPKPKKAFESKVTLEKPAATAEESGKSAAESVPVKEVPAVEKLAAPEKPKKAWGSPASDKPAKAAAKKTDQEGTEAEKEEKPVKKVDFEITNPDDIKIDDKGQLGFF